MFKESRKVKYRRAGAPRIAQPGSPAHKAWVGRKRSAARKRKSGKRKLVIRPLPMHLKEE